MGLQVEIGGGEGHRQLDEIVYTHRDANLYEYTNVLLLTYSLSGACGDILSLQIQRGCVKCGHLITLQRTAKQNQRVFKKSVQV